MACSSRWSTRLRFKFWRVRSEEPKGVSISVKLNYCVTSCFLGEFCSKTLLASPGAFDLSMISKKDLR